MYTYPRCTILVALVIAGCGPGGGAPPGWGHAAITGGAPESGYLAVFSLAYEGMGGCTGTCITPRVGTTAAHCIAGDPAESFTALFGDDEWDTSHVLQVTAVATGPGGSDIALLAFGQDCPATIPVNRTPLEGHVGEPVVMVGFGVTTEMADDAGIKRAGTATLWSVDPAEVSGMEAGELATSNDPAGTCNGDSGGPTFMTFDGTEYMVGTTSRGSIDESTGDEWPCGQGRSIAVRADSYLGFIDDFVAVHDPEARPTEPDADADGDADGDADVDADGDADGDADADGDGDGDGDGAPDDPGDTEGGGCGCLVAGAPADRSPWIAVAAGVIVTASLATRRRRAPPSR
jgi:hypothetical protein